jgi:hypothetical protein
MESDEYMKFKWSDHRLYSLQYLLPDDFAISLIYTSRLEVGRSRSRQGA